MTDHPTCAWCGKRAPMVTWYSQAAPATSLTSSCGIHAFCGPRILLLPKDRHPKPGWGYTLAGGGLVCTLRCGMHFASAAFRAGYRRAAPRLSGGWKR